MPRMSIPRLSTLMAILALGSGCSDESPSDGSPGSGGGTAEEPTPEPPAPDPLGLEDCSALDASLPSAHDLPVASWTNADEHAVMCQLRVLDAVLASRSIICLGENDHGVSESSRYHTLLARYLVHQLGVRTISLETTYASAATWSGFIQTGDVGLLDAGFGDAQGSLANTRELQALIESLSAVAAELPPGETLTIDGFDIAVQPTMTRAAVLDFLLVAAPEEHDAWAAALVGLTAQADFEVAANAADDLILELESNQDAYIAATDEASMTAALINAENLRDGYRFLAYYFAGDFWTGNATFREPGMIRNLERLRATLPEDEPLVVIAHNAHCAQSLTIGTTVDGDPSPAFGTHLATKLGDGYATVAQLYMEGDHLTLAQGSISAQPFAASSASLEAAIGETVSADALLVGTWNDGVTTPLVPLDQEWLIQGPYEQVPAAQHDVLLWLRSVTASTLRD